MYNKGLSEKPIKMGKLTPMLEQFFSMKEKHPDAFLFFRMGDFYEMFGDDAIEAAKLLDITLTARNKGKETEIPMCGVPHHAAQGYISQLTKLGRKVAICEQVSDPKAKGLVERDVVQIVTPGTTFDASVLDQKSSNYLCSITKEKEIYGLGVVDVTTGEFRVAQIPSGLRLLDEVNRFNPSEIIASAIEEDLMQQLEQDYYVTNHAVPAWKDLEQVLTNHFQTIGLEGFGLDDNQLLQSVAANLISYLNETQKSALGHIRHIEQYQLGDHMLLDEATMRNLDLFYNQQTGDAHGSLISVIDKTQTAMGGRLLRWWLAHPLVQAEKIQNRLDAVEVFAKDTEKRESIRQSLSEICDIERLIGKVGTQRVNPRDLHNLCISLKHIPGLKSVLSSISTSLVQKINTSLDKHESLIALIEKTLSEDPPIKMDDGGYIRDGFNTELDDLRQISSKGKQFISDLQERERERTGINSLKVKYNKVFGYYLEVSKSNLSNVPDDYIRKQTLVNAERYITPELKEYEEKVLGAHDRIIQLEFEYFQTLREEVYSHVEALQKTARSIAQLDVITSLADLAIAARYTKPTISQEPVLLIKQARHPVIESIQSEPYIPNDLVFQGDHTLSLLTGPNMSGKSSYLRQNALVVLLAQIGSYVPAQEMTWSIIDRIFTRVGASDNLAKGRSTFMVEMQEAAYILNNATEQSLIILDELGRGTSTYDGLSLAWSISEFLHDGIKAKTLFATHYHELIEVVDELKNAKNFAVAVSENEDGVVFLHQVLEGGISKSYGIEVAKLAGLPQNVLLRSRDLLKRLEEHAWENDAHLKQPTLPLMPVARPQHPIIEKLRDIEPDTLSPIDALKKLYELREEANQD